MPELQKRPLPVEVATSDTASIQRRRWQRDEKNAIVDQVEPRLLGGEDNRMDIEAWLQGLGLERYVPAFRDNEIDWEVLPKLTSDDSGRSALQQSATGASCWTPSPRSAPSRRSSDVSFGSTSQSISLSRKAGT